MKIITLAAEKKHFLQILGPDCKYRTPSASARCFSLDRVDRVYDVFV